MSTFRERKIPVQVYLSENEYYILTQKCAATGCKSKSALIRQLIIYGYTYDVDYSDLQTGNALLGRIAANINQISKRVNATTHIYDEDIKEIKELMNRIWQLQKSILSQQPLENPLLTSATPTKQTDKS